METYSSVKSTGNFGTKYWVEESNNWLTLKKPDYQYKWRKNINGHKIVQKHDLFNQYWTFGD